MSAPLSSVVGIMSPGTWGLGYGFSSTATTATLTVQKVVVGGPASAEDWVLSADGPSPNSGAGGFGPITVDEGTYDFDEDAGPTGYFRGPWVFSGGTPGGPSSRVIPAFADVTATITNYYGGTPPVPQDRWFELRRISASMRPKTRLTVRGGS